jgi:ABC-type polar amino acid transport system ATPase subunit
LGVVVRELVKRYPGRERRALDAVSLEIPRGRTAAILGPSGAGKSTLLRCLVGLEPFDAGTLEIAGVTLAPGLSRADSSRALRGRVGLVFQGYELFPHLSVLDNCTLAPRTVRGETQRAADERARGLLSRLGLADHVRAFPDALSGGQRQRVAIARALCMEPRVLFYDEPTSALDPALRGEVRDTVREVARTGVTQVLVTHDLAFAREASDLAFVLEAGRVAQAGDAAALLDGPSDDLTPARAAG